MREERKKEIEDETETSKISRLRLAMKRQTNDIKELKEENITRGRILSSLKRQTEKTEEREDKTDTSLT